jgi:predicted small integral membrane protein
MTILEMKIPSIEKKGFLPMATTRGDKLFISLLSCGFIHLGFLAFVDTVLWVALCISLLWSAVVFKWG